MKIRISMLLLVLCLLFIAAPALAAENEFSTDPGSTAQFLKELNLFQGTGKGFDLDRGATRQEGITLLVRLLGKEQEALAGEWETPFTDVDNWAKPYVGYAYEHGITNGTGATTFGSGAMISEDQYATFLLRALGYTSGVDFQWDRAAAYGKTLGFPQLSGSFTRGGAAILSRAALEMNMKDGSQTLADSLIAQDVFTNEAFAQTQIDEASGVLAATARANDPNEARKAAYFNFIQNNYASAPVKVLADVTHDGAPELIVALRKSDPYMPHITGTNVYIFTYADDQVKKLYEFSSTTDMMAGYAGDFYLHTENGKTYVLNHISPFSANMVGCMDLYYFNIYGQRQIYRHYTAENTSNYFSLMERYCSIDLLLGTADAAGRANDFAGYVPVDLSLAKDSNVDGGSNTSSGGNVYTVSGVTFRIAFPEHWKERCTIRANQNCIEVYYTRDMNSYGGHLFTISVETPASRWDTFQEIFTVSQGTLGYTTPQDVQFNHTDAISTKEYMQLQNEIDDLMDTVELVP